MELGREPREYKVQRRPREDPTVDDERAWRVHMQAKLMDQTKESYRAAHVPTGLNCTLFQLLLLSRRLGLPIINF